MQYNNCSTLHIPIKPKQTQSVLILVKLKQKQTIQATQKKSVSSTVCHCSILKSRRIGHWARPETSVFFRSSVTECMVKSPSAGVNSIACNRVFRSYLALKCQVGKSTLLVENCDQHFVYKVEKTRMAVVDAPHRYWHVEQSRSQRCYCTKQKRHDDANLVSWTRKTLCRSKLLIKNQSKVTITSISRFSLCSESQWGRSIGFSKPQFASPVCCWVSHEGCKVGWTICK